MQIGLLPGDDEREAGTRSAIADFWNRFSCCEESGEASREDLELLERQVTECLYNNDVAGASSLTAKAFLLMDGGGEF